MDSESPSGNQLGGLRRDPRMLLFIEAARQYCGLVENPPVHMRAWARNVLTALSELYAAALGLRGIGVDRTPDCDLSPYEVSHVEWRNLYHRLCAQLGHDAWYWMYFEPMKTQVEKAEPVAGNLADDLADVYRDVAAGLRAWNANDDPEFDEAVFQWVLGGLDVHWGAHAVDALGILHRVVANRIQEDPESGI